MSRARVLELRERARKVRWLASQLNNDEDRDRLLRHAEEIEQQADALEREAEAGSTPRDDRRSGGDGP